jgi:hypothetical protein
MTSERFLIIYFKQNANKFHMLSDPAVSGKLEISLRGIEPRFLTYPVRSVITILNEPLRLPKMRLGIIIIIGKAIPVTDRGSRL